MISTITQLSADSWQQYRDIRLEALQTDPLAFGGSYEEESTNDVTDWKNRINNMWFALINDEIVGMVGLLKRTDQSCKHCGCIISLWVKPTFRGQGIAKALVQKIQEIAPELGIRKISLHATTTQTNAIKLYEAMGFKKIAVLKENLYKDNQYLDEYLMEWHKSLKLEDALST